MARAEALLKEADYEDYCFDAQQAAEKAIKAVYIAVGATFAYTHDLGKLLSGLVPANVVVPKYLLPADKLTRYAVLTRYPGFTTPVTRSMYDRAVRLAKRVVNWAERQVAKRFP